MSDDEKELEEGEGGVINPDLLEEGLGDEEVDLEERDDGFGDDDGDGDVSLSKAADDEDAEGAESDKYDDIDLL